MLMLDDIGLMWIAFCLIHTGMSGSLEDTKRLFKDRVELLNPRIRPLLNQSETITVSVLCHISAITDFDETLQKVSMTSWLDVKWRDELIAWNASEYGNVTKISPHPDDIWRPNVALSGTFGGTQLVGDDMIIIIVDNNGDALWTPGIKSETFCRVDISKYPFDTQECKIDFFNWGTISGELSLKSDGVNTDHFYRNGEWDLIGTSEREFIVEYNGGEYSKPHVEITIIIKRRPSTICLTVILPVILLSLINVCAFIIPAESGEKLSFSVTVLLSLAVFLSYINSLMPQTSETISYLAVWISAQLVLSSVVVLLESITLAIHHGQIKPGKTNKALDQALMWMTHKPIDDPNYTTKENHTFHSASSKFDRMCLWIIFGITISIMLFFFVALMV
ncbi:hypothetical protein SNE40_002494 [Patella caerulea]